MGRIIRAIRGVPQYFKTQPGSTARKLLWTGYLCSLLFWIYQVLPRWDWVVALEYPTGALFLINIITVIGHVIYAIDRWNDQRDLAAEEKQAAQTRALVAAARLETDRAMVSTLPPAGQAALLHFSEHPTALLWLETHEGGVRLLARKGLLRAVHESSFGFTSYELTPEGEEWLRIPELRASLAALRTDVKVLAAAEEMARWQPEIRKRISTGQLAAKRRPQEEIDLVLGEGLRALAARCGTESLTIRHFGRWARLLSVEDARTLLAELETELQRTQPEGREAEEPAS